MAKTKEVREGNEPPEGKRDEGKETSLARRESSAPPHLAASPFTFMRRFADDFERLFGDFAGGRLSPFFGRELFPSVGFQQTVWSPQVEVFERDGRLTVRADLPGLTKDDVQVEVADDAITISGERHDEQEEEREGYYRSERSYGQFYRRIPLPEGAEAEDATATFKDGVLEVVMQVPRRESRRRRLEIQEGEGQARAKSAGK